MITDILGSLFGSGSKSFSLDHRSAEKENLSEKEDQSHLNVITEHHLHDTPTSPVEEETHSDEDNTGMDLNQMKVIDLRTLADKRGITIPKHFKRKSEIIELLQNPSMLTDDNEETEKEPEKVSRKRKASSVASAPVSAPTTRRSSASMDSQDESKNKKRKAGGNLALKSSTSTSPSTQRSKHSPYKLRTPKQLAHSHDRSHDSAYDYYAVDKRVPSPSHQLRTEKELRKSHKNALDQNYVYAPQAHIASPNGKKSTTATSARKSSCSAAGRSRAYSHDETPPKLKPKSPVKKSPVSRRKSGRRNATEPAETSDDESSVASSRFPNMVDPMLRMVKEHSIKSHPSEMDIDSESQQENFDNNDGQQRRRGRINKPGEKPKRQQNNSNIKEHSSKLQKARQEDIDDNESEESDDGYGGGDDMNMNVEVEEEPNGTFDGNEEKNENQSDLGDDDMQNIHAALAAHDGTESQMDERFMLVSSSPERVVAHRGNGNNNAVETKKISIQHEDVMDLVSSGDDEAEVDVPIQPSSQPPSHAPISVAPSVAAPATQDATTPAVKAVKHLASRLEAAAMQLENNQESQVPISEKEYDIIRNFLEKIKPVTAAGSAAKTFEESDTAAEPLSLNKKRVSIDPTSPMVVDDAGMPFSTSKRRRDDDGFPIPSARPSYDGGSWRSRESFLPDMSTASPAASGLPSIAGNLFGRASFGANGLVARSVLGRQQTPYNRSYRPSFSEEKEMLPSSVGQQQTPWYQPSLSQPSASSASYPLTNITSASNGVQGARPLGSGRPLSAGSFGSVTSQKQSPGYTPQYRGSSANFSLQSRDSIDSSRAGDESSLSYLERRKMKRLSEASVSASVAHQILETLGQITSPDPARRSSALMAEEAKVLKGTVAIPQFLTQSQQQQQQQQAKEVNTQGKSKQVSFALTETAKAHAESNKQPSSADDRMDVSDKEELEDVDEIVMTKPSRSLASKSSEFQFDEPMVVQGVEDVELPLASSRDGNGIKYTFTPPSKRKKPQQEVARVPVVPVQKAPAVAISAPTVRDDKRVPETPAASAPPAEVPSIWTVKAKGKKCPHCMVMNKEDASKCASCEQPLEGGEGGFGAPAAPSASGSNAFTPAKGFGVGVVSATPAAISFGATPAAPSACGGAISTGGFMFGGAPPAAVAAFPPSGKETEKPALAAPAPSAGFSFSTPATPAAAPVALKVDNAPFTGFTVPTSTAATEDPSQAAAKPAMPFEFKLRASESDKPTSSSALPSFGGAPVTFGAGAPNAKSATAAPAPAPAAALPSSEGGRGRDRDEDDGDGPSRKRRNNEESSFSSDAASGKAMFSGALTTSTSANSKDEPPKSASLPSFSGSGASDASSSKPTAAFAFPTVPPSFSSPLGAPAPAVATEATKKEEVSIPAPFFGGASNIFASSFAPAASSASQPAPSATTTTALPPAPFIFGASKPVAASVPPVATTALVPVANFPTLTSTTSGGSNITLPVPIFSTSISGGDTTAPSSQPFGASSFGAPKKIEEAPSTPAFNVHAFGSQQPHTASTPTFGSSGDGMDTGSNIASPLVMGNSGPPVSISNAVSSAPLYGAASAPAMSFVGFNGSNPAAPSSIGIAGFSQPNLAASQSAGGFGSAAPVTSFGNVPSSSAAPFMFGGGQSAPALVQSGGFAGFGGASIGGFPAAPSDGGGIFATSTSHGQLQPAGGNIFGMGGSTANQPGSAGGNPMFGGGASAAPPSSGGFGGGLFTSSAAFPSIPGTSLPNQVSAFDGGAIAGNANPFGSASSSTGFSLGSVGRSESNQSLAGRRILKASMKKKTG